MLRTYLQIFMGNVANDPEISIPLIQHHLQSYGSVSVQNREVLSVLDRPIGQKEHVVILGINSADFLNVFEEFIDIETTFNKDPWELGFRSGTIAHKSGSIYVSTFRTDLPNLWSIDCPHPMAIIFVSDCATDDQTISKQWFHKIQREHPLVPVILLLWNRPTVNDHDNALLEWVPLHCKSPWTLVECNHLSDITENRAKVLEWILAGGRDEEIQSKWNEFNKTLDCMHMKIHLY